MSHLPLPTSNLLACLAARNTFLGPPLVSQLPGGEGAPPVVLVARGEIH